MEDRNRTKFPSGQLPSIRFNRCHFSDNVVLFTLFGLVTFNECLFQGYTSVILDVNEGQGQQEPEVTTEIVRSFRSSDPKEFGISIVASRFAASIMFINVYAASRKIIITNSSFQDCPLVMATNKNTEYKPATNTTPTTLVSTSIEHSTFFRSDIQVQVWSLSYLFLEVKHTQLWEIGIDMYGNGGVVGLRMHESDWFSSGRLTHLLGITYVNITSSHLRVEEYRSYFCTNCDALTVHGQCDTDLMASHLFGTNLDGYNCCPLYLQGVTFTGTGGLIGQRYFNFNDVEVVLIDTKLVINESIVFNPKPAADLVARNATVQCASAHVPKRVKGLESIAYTCTPTCPGDNKYTLQAGNMTVSEHSSLVSRIMTELRVDGLSVRKYSPSCLTCPLGANCDDVIEALPNYWGYVNKGTDASMIRCPVGYCCQGNETCEGINSCNTGRRGTLCGTCQESLTESLFSPECLPTQNCHTTLVIILYFSCAMTYLSVILTSSSIKKRIVTIVKKLFMAIKRKLKRSSTVNQRKESQHEDPTEKKSEDKHSGSMKYVQILFYYVQDARLFKIPLPGPLPEASIPNVIVQFLEFSPQVLNIYSKASDLCFVYTTVLKVLYQSMFGLVIIIFLFLIYAFQEFVSRFVRSNYFLKVKAKLVQAFFLTILFSYQKLVMGAFTLVQCVRVGEHNVLYIQGDIQCYTPWQVGIQVYICLCIIPIAFVLSHEVFYVENKKMSVCVFVLECLFPLPVMICYHLSGLISRVKVTIRMPKQDGATIEVPPGGIEPAESLEMKYDCALNTDTMDDPKCTDKNTSTEREVLYTLLKHYRRLTFLGVQFTWLGVHLIYRVLLVVCYTYVTEPLTRLYVMTSVLMTTTVASIFLKPYKNRLANKTAALSYVASLSIAILNISKAVVVTFNCDTNCTFKNTLLWYLTSCEDVLLLYMPAVAFGFWLISYGIRNCCSKATTLCE